MKRNLKQGALSFFKGLKVAPVLHICSPGANLTGKAIVTALVQGWDLEVIHLNQSGTLFGPFTIDSVETKTMRVYRWLPPGFNLAPFILLLSAYGLVSRAELRTLYQGVGLGGAAGKFHVSMQGVLDDFVQYWPQKGLSVSVLPSLIKRLQRFGFATRKIIVYNYDPRNLVLTDRVNWPVLRISATGRIIKVGPYVGERAVSISKSTVA